MICKRCKNSGGTTSSVDDLVQDIDSVEDTISCSNNSPSDILMELTNLESTIARLTMKQYELKRNVNRRHSPFIRIIPSEIIAMISGFANTKFAITGRLPTSKVLSSVCSDWRRTVLGAPELWSSIRIDLPSTSQTPDMASSALPRLATLIDEWLSRSGQLPLNISLCYGHHDDVTLRFAQNPPDPLTLEKYRPILKILDKYSSRWHSFYISIPTNLLSFLQPRCLPLLEQLYITYTFYGYPDHSITFPPTPCLNTVKIQPFLHSGFLITPNIGIQWDTVTHVSLESITSCNCFALLRLNPQLVHCTFHNVVDDKQDHLESPIVSSLTYLSLHHKRDASRILDNIKLPCLKTLVLFNVIIDPVISFIQRSACSLHTLSLLEWQIRKTDKLLPLLQFLSPTLKRLAISRNPSPIRGTKNYLSLLTRIYTSQSEVVENDFLPHLEIFEYREESPSKLKTSVLSNLPSEDYPTPATSISLRSAYISASVVEKEVPGDISVILQRLEEDGILSYT